MNRRGFLTMLGLSPVAATLPAVASETDVTAAVFIGDERLNRLLSIAENLPTPGVFWCVDGRLEWLTGDLVSLAFMGLRITRASNGALCVKLRNREVVQSPHPGLSGLSELDRHDLQWLLDRAALQGART